MLLLRIGIRSRWAADRTADEPDHVARAAVDLELRPDEDGLSVFRVEGGDDSREVAVRFALNCRDDRGPIDYLVFPSELVERLGLVVASFPREDLDSRLSERHYEILGLTPELTIRLAAAILADTGRHVERVQKGDVIRLAVEICRRDPELQDRLKGDWATKLAPLLGDSTSRGGMRAKADSELFDFAVAPFISHRRPAARARRTPCRRW
jgi:hypothetical protein